MAQPEPSRGARIFAVFFLLAIFIGVIYFVNTMFDSGEEDKVTTKLNAYVMAQVFVENKLVSPKSAEFPPMNEAKIIKIDDTTFVVMSYVDSKNRLGVMLRSNYSCTLNYSTTNDIVTCDNVKIQER